MMRVSATRNTRKQNKSFGLTTLRNRHVKVKGTRVVFDFRGKHGIKHHIDLDDRRLARDRRALPRPAGPGPVPVPRP